jgi:hypothetical protein
MFFLVAAFEVRGQPWIEGLKCLGAKYMEIVGFIRAQ